jgi:hypothetical protein
MKIAAAEVTLNEIASDFVSHTFQEHNTGFTQNTPRVRLASDASFPAILADRREPPQQRSQSSTFEIPPGTTASVRWRGRSFQM